MNDAPTPRVDAIVPTQGRKRTMLEYIEELEALARQLERELAAERALADRLCACLERHAWLDGHETPNESEEALAAWKASRDQNNLEGAGPTEKERCENARAIKALTVPERFALMFGNQTKEEP